MAVMYPSDGWVKELQKICNADPEFREACGDFAGKFIFQIDPEPGKLDKAAFLFFAADKGDASEAMALSSTDERPDAEYVIAGKYSVWKDIVRAKQEPLRALMTRKLRLIKGSQLKVLKQVKFALKMMNNCTRIDATYADDKA
ncbi:MAG: SCP2 sterol-binding domain-containing protein [bacterium]